MLSPVLVLSQLRVFPSSSGAASADHSLFSCFSVLCRRCGCLSPVPEAESTRHPAFPEQVPAEAYFCPPAPPALGPHPCCGSPELRRKREKATQVAREMNGMHVPRCSSRDAVATARAEPITPEPSLAPLSSLTHWPDSFPHEFALSTASARWNHPVWCLLSSVL